MENVSSSSLPHERVLVRTGVRSRLRITVALHSTLLGPAIGGCRVWSYQNPNTATDDALRLSAAMTLKTAAAGLNAGGGKAVVHIPIGEKLTAERKRAAMLDLGDLVDSFRGSYRTAEDVGTTELDMQIVAERTPHVLGLPAAAGGAGEPAFATAAGVYSAIIATVEQLGEGRSLPDCRIAVAGLGQVGSRLASELAAAGATLVVTDMNPTKHGLAASFGATWVAPEQIHRQDVDLFVPAGVGGMLTSQVINELRCSAVVGPANNQFEDRSGAEQLHSRGIIWAPDFVVNAGGVIYVALTAEGRDEDEVNGKVAGIGGVLKTIYSEANRAGRTTRWAAEELATSRLDLARSESALASA